MFTEFLHLIVGTAYAQEWTSTTPMTSTTIFSFSERIRDEGFDGLQDILPLLFGAGITIGLAILIYRWIKGMISRPR